MILFLRIVALSFAPSCGDVVAQYVSAMTVLFGGLFDARAPTTVTATILRESCNELMTAWR